MSIIDKTVVIEHNTTAQIYTQHGYLWLKLEDDFSTLSFTMNKDSLAYLIDVVNIAEKHLKNEETKDEN